MDNIEKKEATLDDLMQVISNYFGYAPEEINVSHRFDPIKTIRFYFCNIAYHKLKYPYQSIGNYLQGKTHASIINAVNRIDGWAENDMKVRFNVIAIESELSKKYADSKDKRYAKKKNA